MVNKIRKISAYFTDTTEFFPDFTKSMEGYYENSKQYNLDVISDESLNIAIRKSGNFGCFKVYHDIDDFLNQWNNIKVINKNK